MNDILHNTQPVVTESIKGKKERKTKETRYSFNEEKKLLEGQNRCGRKEMLPWIIPACLRLTPIPDTSR